MIPQPWRCTEREKTPAPSAVCTHPTPGSTTTTTTEPGCLQHPQQLHTGCRNLSLRERTQFRCPVGGEMPSCQAQRKSEPSSQRWAMLIDTYSRQIPPQQFCELEGIGKLWHRDTSQQMVLSDVLPMLTCRLNLVEQSEKILFGLRGTSSAPCQPEKGMKFQGITWPGGARRAGNATLEKCLFAIKFGLQKAFSHLAQAK